MSLRVILNLQRVTVAPGAEWPLATGIWRFQRVDSGVGYCITAADRRELAAGDALLSSPKAEGVIRASRLGELELNYFEIAPELLGGVLTVAERHYLEDAATQTLQALSIFHAHGPIAREFSEVERAAQESPTLAHRCRLLALFAQALAPTPGDRWRELNGSVQAAARFEKLMARLPEQELLLHTPTALAALCGCGIRHFGRLFHAHFGMSIRAKQNQLRMEKARQLLREGGSRLLDVAQACGFRHLGRFNAAFKRHTGVPPSAWRRQKQGELTASTGKRR